MAKKITQLPTASLVRPQDYVPIVDINDVQTEKATLTQIVAGVDGLVATLTGSNFSGPIIASGGLTGSLTKLPTGISYLVGGPNTIVTSMSNGQVMIAATGGASAAAGTTGDFQYNLGGSHAPASMSFANGVITATVPFTASMGLNTTYVSATLGVNTTQVSASLGFTGSHISLGTGPTAATGLVRLNAPSAATTHFLRFRNANTDYDLLQIDTSSGTVTLGNLTAHTSSVRGYAVDIVAGAGNFVTITSNGTEAARFTSTLNTIPLNTRFTGPLTASLGVSGSHGSFGTLPATDGDVRITNGGRIKGRSVTPANNVTLMELATTDRLWIGTNSSLTEQAGHINLYAGTLVNVGVGSGDNFNCSTTDTTFVRRVTFSAPVTASVGISGSHGEFGRGHMAQTGAIRLQNGGNIFARNESNTDDIPLVYSDGNTIFYGSTPSYNVGPQATGLRIYSTDGGIFGTGGNNSFGWGALLGYDFGVMVPATFTSTVLAAGVSSSYYSLDGSGNNKPSTGMIRVPYNMGNTDKVITAMYSDDSTDKDILKYGPGNTWLLGNVDQTFNIDGYSFQTVAQYGASSHYHNTGFLIYNYDRAAYDLTINSTGFNLNTKPGGKATDRTTIGHRLTLSSSVPVISGSAISGSTLYMTPYLSNQIALYDNTDWWLYETNEISISLTSSLLINNNYDVFATPDGATGNVKLEFGPAWTTGSIRATSLARRDGVLVLSSSHAKRYIGTIRTTSATTTEDSTSKRFVWNMYNQIDQSLSVTDSTTSWSYAATAFRYARGVTTNKVEIVIGQPTPIAADATAVANHGASGRGVYAGIGINNTSNVAVVTTQFASTAFASETNPSMARYDASLNSGHYTIGWLEGLSSANTTTIYGTSSGSTQGLRVRTRG